MDHPVFQACHRFHHLKDGPKPRHGMSGFTARQTMSGPIAHRKTRAPRARQDMSGLTAHQMTRTPIAHQTMSGLIAHQGMNGLTAHQKTRVPRARQDMSGLTAHQPTMGRFPLLLVEGRTLHPSIMTTMVHHRRRPRSERKYQLCRQEARSPPSHLGEGRDAEWEKWDQGDIARPRKAGLSDPNHLHQDGRPDLSRHHKAGRRDLVHRSQGGLPIFLVKPLAILGLVTRRAGLIASLRKMCRRCHQQKNHRARPMKTSPTAQGWAIHQPMRPAIRFPWVRQCRVDLFAPQWNSIPPSRHQRVDLRVHPRRAILSVLQQEGWPVPRLGAT